MQVGPGYPQGTSVGVRVLVHPGEVVKLGVLEGVRVPVGVKVEVRVFVKVGVGVQVLQ